LLQGHAVTLTLKVAIQMLCTPHCLNMVIISVKFLKSNFKLWSYVPDTILIQGPAVTLTFKVATQMLRVHIVHIATYSCTKYHAPSFNSFKLSKDPDF